VTFDLKGKKFDTLGLSNANWKLETGLDIKIWCDWRGSNPRPLASEANTLSTELQSHEKTRGFADYGTQDSNHSLPIRQARLGGYNLPLFSIPTKQFHPDSLRTP
jgi:hypothetical protein